MKLVIVFALTVACISAASLQSIVFPGFPEGRIINGQEASKGAAPYIVSLSIGIHFCAGCIIDKHWVLTAAHCMIFDTFEVIGGLHKRDDESNTQVRQVKSTANQIVHGNYSGGVGPNDIALIYIEEAFDLNALNRDGSAPVGKINLPSGKHQQTGKGSIYGWGLNNFGALPNILQTLDVDIIDYSECKAILPRGSALGPFNICSYTAGTTDGACTSDSGGPLIINTDDGPELVGLVSWGYTPCASKPHPTIYTGVSNYIAWIADKISSYSY